MSTFLSYDNRILTYRRKRVGIEALPTLLNVSDLTAKRFWDEACPKYLIESEFGIEFTETSGFSKGQLSVKRKGEFCCRLYIAGVKSLYKEATVGEHKLLGKLVKLISFIDAETNLLCWNSYGEDYDDIERMPIADICMLLNYDITHVSTLLRKCKKMKIDINGEKQNAFFIDYEYINQGKANIMVNPHIIYSGSNYEQVDALRLSLLSSQCDN